MISTFLSAAEDLQSSMELPEVKEELGRCGVTWRFISKKAPDMGVLGTPSRYNCVSTQEDLGETPHISDIIRNNHC